MNRYRIDPGRSRFVVQAFATGLLSSFGHNPTFLIRSYIGELRLGSTAESLALELGLDPDSLDLEDRVSEKDRREIQHRMHDEVLEVDRYRTASYRGRATRAVAIDQGRYQVSIDGVLNLHGAERPHPIDAELIVFGDGLRLGGAGTLRMSEYGIRPVSALGGAIKLKDELQLRFDLAALPVPS
jgi:polyisoprenoid-binding protein YceI